MTCKVALIGYGAIARAICAGLAGDGSVTIAQIVLRPGRTEERRPDLPSGTKAITSLDELSPDISLVLECAGHEAVRSFAPACLRRGIDFALLSAGALADRALEAQLKAATDTAGARLILVPGAIGGIDALAAAGDALDTVLYTARKPPLSWSGTPAEDTHDLARIDRATPVFEGNARDAALAFPKNANVVATVALAGVGFDKTQVTLLADPQARGNSHRICATGPLYDFDYTTASAALPANPKTSALTAASAIRTLKHRAAGLQV